MDDTMRSEGVGVIILSLVAGVLGYFQKTRKISFIPALMSIWAIWYDLKPVFNYGAGIGIGTILMIAGSIAIVAGSAMEITKFVKKKKEPLS